MNDEIRCAVELRADETRQGPGRLVGRIVRYGERARRPRGAVRARGAELAGLTVSC